MKSLPVLIVGLALAALAAPADAQWRAGDRRGPVERPVFQPREFRPPPPREFRPPPPPPPMRGPPPRPGGENDSLGAGWTTQQDEVRAGVTQRRFIPLGQAIDSIRRRNAGRELDAGLEQWGGRAAYRVRWASPDGQRIDYIVDAESGAILSADGGP